MIRPDHEIDELIGNYFGATRVDIDHLEEQIERLRYEGHVDWQGIAQGLYERVQELRNVWDEYHDYDPGGGRAVDSYEYHTAVEKL